MNIFVGNLSFEAKEVDVQRAFSAFGVVTSVVIVMEKKGKKSRGFGFVEMPDEQEALAAIAQLQGKEILSRPINVMPALSKEPKNKPTVLVDRRNKYSAAVANDNQEISRLRHDPSDFRLDPSFKRTGKYKEGRRTLSYLKKRKESGITVPVSERKYKSNPMRWRKKPRSEQPFARPKPEGELKPWQRPQTESNPWKKPGVKSNSWKKPEGQAKPWQRNESTSRPWKRAEGESRPWEKSRSGAKTWVKSENSEARPWKKTESKSKPWRKSSAQRVQSGFKKRISFRGK
jgi:RNA recognition motif-containing protein